MNPVTFTYTYIRMYKLVNIVPKMPKIHTLIDDKCHIAIYFYVHSMYWDIK